MTVSGLLVLAGAAAAAVAAVSAAPPLRFDRRMFVARNQYERAAAALPLQRSAVYSRAQGSLRRLQAVDNSSDNSSVFDNGTYVDWDALMAQYDDGSADGTNGTNTTDIPLDTSLYVPPDVGPDYFYTNSIMLSYIHELSYRVSKEDQAVYFRLTSLQPDWAGIAFNARRLMIGADSIMVQPGAAPVRPNGTMSEDEAKADGQAAILQAVLTSYDGVPNITLKAGDAGSNLISSFSTFLQDVQWGGWTATFARKFAAGSYNGSIPLSLNLRIALIAAWGDGGTNATAMAGEHYEDSTFADYIYLWPANNTASLPADVFGPTDDGSGYPSGDNSTTTTGGGSAGDGTPSTDGSSTDSGDGTAATGGSGDSGADSGSSASTDTGSGSTPAGSDGSSAGTGSDTTTDTGSGDGATASPTPAPAASAAPQSETIRANGVQAPSALWQHLTMALAVVVGAVMVTQ